ncbi:glycosyltransferase family 2 protein [Metabacillus malikii]|uniref:GT2 family glycosyltransferase n=1 Tax=Metabacillus malikii TaxID=1504265 RepID=A0ABT9ZHY5_9BACI|nr:glycosyltransferase family 2 protein [Metabacillus malikii]MDQ0231426.1 GT2 family glycosyltransferase [Metabacillus malikii]
MDKVDILLPIYNSYEETKNCIESILAHTSENSYNLFLLDDKSPDVRIEQLTKEYSKLHANIFAVRNETNLGFPGNVNNGFKISENDVIVLNSDTLVSPGWLEGLWTIANSDERIAAVNPMSNYGIISGLPTANSEINSLFTFEEIYKLYIKYSSVQRSVESPLLIGYCMYMKRSALNSVGLFDSETFKRGYGEESDWCMRARKQGLKLVVATNAYVHHIGGVSFGAEKEKLRSTSREILLKRYPNIDFELEQFVKNNYFKDMRKGIIKELGFVKRKTTVPLKLKMIKHYFLNLKG